MARVLIVDDEKMICEEFRDILQDEGHEVEMVLNGFDALHKVEESNFDIVFLDVLMPRMEGREVFEKMKKIRDIPIVIMSGYLPPNKEAEILKMGALACLKKPLDLDQVKSLIESVKSSKSE